MKILVHICCAPDSLYFLKKLRENFKDSKIVGYFYDPNIHPPEEYRLRYLETKRVCRKLGIDLIEGDYEPEKWMEGVRGFEEEPERGRRCSICFDMRLERSAKVAKELGCDAITTTLLMSPKKSFQQLVESGEKVAELYGIKFLAPDYRKGGGVQEMFRLSEEEDIYRQNYCGCLYGLFNQKEGNVFWDLLSLRGRRPGSKEEILFIKEVRLYAESLELPVKEYEFPFLNWKPLEGGLWVKGEAIPSIVVPFSQSVRGKLRGKVIKIFGDTLYLNKQFVRITLVDEFIDRPVRVFQGYTNPTLLVPSDFKEALIKNTVEVRLKTEFLPDRSRVLLIGHERAKRLKGIPADTLQDGRGFDLKEVLSKIKDLREEIKRGEVGVVLLGAHSLGEVGRRYFEEITGRKVKDVEPYP